ncbi:hypothetical protein [Hymenobacter montanus]|uniref:hypothetical protein n=1 Tax=Hymenobacter montanus TaxID=2771359 RepID=UPI001F0A4325|nr:hypothetical protein [Hymenobacter montanus]
MALRLNKDGGTLGVYVTISEDEIVKNCLSLTGEEAKVGGRTPPLDGRTIPIDGQVKAGDVIVNVGQASFPFVAS